MSRLLTEATIQEIQLELIRRAGFNACDGERVVKSLERHRELWEAVLMDRLGVTGTGGLAASGLIKLRDLSDNYWNVDTLYILCPDAARARRLAEIIESEDWGGMVQLHDREDAVQRALGGGDRSAAIVSVWWD